MKTSPSDCPPRRARVHASHAELKWPRLLRISFRFFPRPRGPTSLLPEREILLVSDRSSVEYPLREGEDKEERRRGKIGSHGCTVSVRTNRQDEYVSSCLQEYCISARSSVRFPLRIPPYFSFSLSLSLSLLRYARTLSYVSSSS